MNLEFNLRTKTVVGIGAIEKIQPFITKNNFSKVGVIVDRALQNNSYVISLKDGLKQDNKLAVEWFYNLPFEPDYDSLDKIKELFKEGSNPKVDVLIAVGGGSVLDFGKGLATVVNNDGPAIQFRGFPENLKPSIPLIAVPTTAGTASEVTFNAVFTDTKGKKKLGINTHNNFPVMAVLDANLTKDCPYPVALSAGLDALVHTFESFACNNSNPYTKIFAKAAFKNLFNNIQKALQENTDDAREKMLFGAHLAGISLFNAGSGPAGALSYPLGVIFKVPHGIAGGFVLPHLVKHNVDRGYTEYAELYDEIDGANFTLDARSKSQELVKQMFSLYDKLDVWKKTSAFKVNADDPEFVDYVNNLQGAFNQNPVPFSISDGMNIIRQIFNS